MKKNQSKANQNSKKRKKNGIALLLLMPATHIAAHHPFDTCGIHCLLLYALNKSDRIELN